MKKAQIISEKKEKKLIRGTCLCCPGSEDLLPLNEVLYNGFGGYSVHKNGKYFWSGDPLIVQCDVCKRTLMNPQATTEEGTGWICTECFNKRFTISPPQEDNHSSL